MIAVAAVAAIALRIGSLARLPLGYDEAASVYIARMPFLTVLANNAAFNSSPPAMLLLLHLVLQIGESETFVRAISAVSGLVTIALVYRIGEQLHPMRRQCGALAALLFALSSQQILYAQQFRVYALGELFGAMGLLAALAFARRPGWPRAALTGLVFFAGIQVQYALTPFFAAVGVALLCGRYDPPRPVRDRLGYLTLIAGVAIAGIVLAYESALKDQMYAGRGTTYSETLFSSQQSLTGQIGRFLHMSWDLITWGLDLWSMPFSGTVLMGFCAQGVWTLARRNGRDPFLIAAFCPLLIFGALSVVDYYPYGPIRQCLILTLPFYALAAFGVMETVSSRSQSVRRIAMAALALLPLGLAVERGVYLANPVPEAELNAGDFRAGLRRVLSGWQPGDAIFVPPGSFPAYDYYARRQAMPPSIVAKGAVEWMQDERTWRKLVVGEPVYATQLDELIRSSPRVWMLYSHYHPGEMTLPVLAGRRGWIDRVDTIMQGSTAGEGNELYLYHR